MYRANEENPAVEKWVDALRQAKANGVNVMAIQCQVTDTDVMADKFVEVRL